MIRTRFGNLIVLACMGAVAACTSGGGTDTAAGNTDINLTIGQDGSAQAFDVDRVDYTVFCTGADTGPADTPDGTPINDAADFSGQFEIVDDRDPPVWQALMDLPPGPCTITLSVSDEDEVVCTGTETVTIVADADPVTINKFNIELVCDLSIQSPVGNADVDGTFRFVTGNFCPSLYVFNAIPSVHAIDGDGISDLQVRALDFDNTCGTSCDPDGPSPGLSTTVTCSGGIQSPLGGDGSDSDNYTLDCNGQVGDITCIVDATDGDLDCDKQKTLTVTCPGANPCDTDPCNDGNDCTANECTPVDETNVTCDNPPLPAGTVCAAVGGGLCDGAGVCVAQGCLNDNPDCNLDGNECTEAPAGSCVAGDCTLAEVPVTDGTPCSGGLGACQAGTCIDNCTGVDCDDTGPNAECTQNLCDPSTNPGTCSNPPVTDCTNCCDDGSGPGSGNCAAGICEAGAVPNVCAQFAPVPVPLAPGQTCDGSDAANTCICEKLEFLAIDCNLINTFSVPVPVQASLQQLGVASAGNPVPTVPQDAIVLPASLVCGFIDAGFTSATVSNSAVVVNYSNAAPTSSQLNSFVDDGTAGGQPVSPHNPVVFSFVDACGDACPIGGGTCATSGDTCTTTADCSNAETGPGVVVPFLAGSGALPTSPPPPVVLTPGGAASVDVTSGYNDVALNLSDIGAITGCLGGNTALCDAGPICVDRTRPAGAATPDTSRFMYDSTCNKAQFNNGDCAPFEFFTDASDICWGPGRYDALPNILDGVPYPPCCDQTANPDPGCTNAVTITTCCDYITANYPTATGAQFPQLWVNP